MDYQAELRVYQPLAAFDDATQTQVLEARQRTRSEVEYLSAQRADQRVYRDPSNPFPLPSQPELVRVLRVPVKGVKGHPEHLEDADQADHREYAGFSEFFCPEELALRSELAVQQLTHLIPDILFDYVVPPDLREANLNRLLEQAEQQQGNLHDDGDDGLQVHTRTAVWGIPMAWFTLFDTDDQAYTANHPYSGHFTARIVTPLALALERGRQAAALISLHSPDWEVLDDVVGLVAWLQHFHPDAMLELDYGGLARLVWPDDSISDVRTALESLQERDFTTAMVANHRLVRRWLTVRHRGRAN